MWCVSDVYVVSIRTEREGWAQGDVCVCGCVYGNMSFPVCLCVYMCPCPCRLTLFSCLCYFGGVLTGRRVCTWMDTRVLVCARRLLVCSVHGQ